ncbi:MAG: hypothetical protein ACLROA_09895 [Turicibacter sp.]
MIENNVENNVGDKDKKNYNYYFPLFMGLGLIFGVVLNQIAIGLCLGVVVGLTVDYKKKK